MYMPLKNQNKLSENGHLKGCTCKYTQVYICMQCLHNKAVLYYIEPQWAW